MATGAPEHVVEAPEAMACAGLGAETTMRDDTNIVARTPSRTLNMALRIPASDEDLPIHHGDGAAADALLLVVLLVVLLGLIEVSGVHDLGRHRFVEL